MPKIKIGVVSLFLISSAFVLSGCGNKNQTQNQTQNQEENKAQIQTQTMEQKRDGTGKLEDGARKGNPPSGMTEACKDKTEGDSCEITMPNREGKTGEANKITGSCKKIGENESLICAPANMPQRGPKTE